MTSKCTSSASLLSTRPLSPSFHLNLVAATQVRRSSHEFWTHLGPQTRQTCGPWHLPSLAGSASHGDRPLSHTHFLVLCESPQPVDLCAPQPARLLRDLAHQPLKRPLLTSPTPAAAPPLPASSFSPPIPHAALFFSAVFIITCYRGVHLLADFLSVRVSHWNSCCSVETQHEPHMQFYIL